MDDPTARLRAVPWDALEGRSAIACEGIAAVLVGEPAERVIDRALRARRELPGEARSAIVEAIFGVGLWRRRLAAEAGIPLAGARAEVLLASLLRDLAGLPEARALALSGAASLGRGAPRGWRETWSFPDPLADVLEAELSGDVEAFARAVSTPGPIALRANTLRCTRLELRESLAHDGVAARLSTLAPDALVVESLRPNLLGTRAHREGLFEVQDEGSQLAGLLTGAHPGERVLDLCAGAGGKTLQLACVVGPSGQVTATDIDGERLRRLERRAERAGARNVTVVNHVHDAQAFDRVLVDAPCSELGPLRRGPDMRFRLDPASFDALPAVQLGILSRAAAHVRPGGTLTYVTCTLRRAENEAVAEAFERAHPAFTRDSPGLRLLPHVDGTDGFFGARWTRAG